MASESVQEMMPAIFSIAVILVTVGIYGLVHSWLASQQAKRQIRRLLGASPVDRFYRLAYNAFAVLSLLPVLALALLLPDHPLYMIPFPWILLTLALQGLAVVALIVGLLQTGPLDFIGLSQPFEPTHDREKTLVTNGLYRWVRHPLYTAGFVFIWLSPVMTTNLLTFYLGLSLYLWIGAHFEEQKLLREYGESYQRYRQKTPMFVPRLPRD
jgi:protein-S-isoprenylcysteine O-methyltransferase Ste14